MKNVINKHKSNKIKENSNTVRHLNNGTDRRHSKSCCDQSSPARRTIKQIKICAEYRDMLPRPRLDLSGTPGLRPIGLSPGSWQTSLGLGSMSRYSAQILICIAQADRRTEWFSAWCGPSREVRFFTGCVKSLLSIFSLIIWKLRFVFVEISSEYSSLWNKI